MILQQGYRRPYHPIGKSGTFCRLEEQVQIRCGWQVLAYEPRGLSVHVQKPQPLVGWEAQKKRRKIIADWPDAYVVPVDQPGFQPVWSGKDEDVGGPEIAVKERLRSTEFRQRSRSERLPVEEFRHSFKQAIPQG
jgi:hypothetical protein